MSRRTGQATPTNSGGGAQRPGTLDTHSPPRAIGGRPDSERGASGKVAPVKVAVGGPTLLLVLVVGLVGPSFTPDGTSNYSGAEREQAIEALEMSHLLLDNPIERGWIRARVIDYVRPITRNFGWETQPCSSEVLVKTYGPFWLPYSGVVVHCGSLIRVAP